MLRWCGSWPASLRTGQGHTRVVDSSPGAVALLLVGVGVATKHMQHPRTAMREQRRRGIDRGRAVPGGARAATPEQHPTSSARQATHKQRHPRGRRRRRLISGAINDARSAALDQHRPRAACEQLRSSGTRTARKERRAASEKRRSKSAGTADLEARTGGNWGRTNAGQREREPKRTRGRSARGGGLGATHFGKSA